MNLATNRNRTSPQIAASETAFARESRQRYNELKEIADLAERFNRAHVKLNEIELALHDRAGDSDRSDLLRSLEDARGEYMDARFALSVKSEHAYG